eukprot:CAMPEP_0114997388 /NCGR_PEP_ID=MMETSP0216-20121206/14871_1 /TAXON_ID=223996 /ORGANISM="Protocruzia adherens, Strain Boccale" /LENGTH=792 /DNA_ID=CAMNT_0002361763 /DNA_START=28 /DNA_END=2404 /DNA_ORIENTATION=+
MSSEKKSDSTRSSSSRLQVLSQRIQESIQNFFFSWGKVVGKHPLKVFLVSLIVLASFIVGFFTVLEKFDDPLLIWVPDGCQARRDRDKIEEVFGETTRAITVFGLPKNLGENILNVSAFGELYQFDRMIRQDLHVNAEVNGNNRDWYYSDLCFKQRQDGQACEMSSIPLVFLGKFNEAPYPDFKSFESVSSNDELVSIIQKGRKEGDNLSTVNILSMFGKTTPPKITKDENSSTNVYDITSAEALSFLYLLKSDDEWDSQGLYGKFEDLFLDKIDEFNKTANHIYIYAWTDTLLDDSFQGRVQGDLPLMFLGIFLITVYSIFVISKFHTVHSKVFVALTGIGSVYLAYLAASGMAAYLGFHSSMLNPILIFLLMGIGVDDMYVLTQALGQTDTSLDVPDRIAHMMKNAGLAITITSFTNCFAFALSSTSSMEALAHFSVFAALGVLWDYLCQITLFSAVLVYDLKRKEQGKKDLLGLCFCDPSGAFCCHGKQYHEGESRLTKFFYKTYTPFLLKKWVKVAVLVIFSAWFAVAIWGATNIETDFRFEWLLEGSESWEGVEIQEDYFPDRGFPVDFFSFDVDFPSSRVQSQLKTLQTNVKSCKGCDEDWTDGNTLTSWYNVYSNWIEEGNCSGVTLTSDNYIPAIEFNSCLSKFASNERFARYASQLRWNANQELRAAKIAIDTYSYDTSVEGASQMDDLRDVAKTGPPGTIAFRYRFLFSEQVKVFIKEAMQSILLALLSVAIVTLLLISNPLVSALVLLMVALVDVELLALMYFWDTQINAVSITNVVMAIG